MAKIRNRCLVLGIIKVIQPCTILDVSNYIKTAGNDLTYKQVASAFYQLACDDEIVHIDNSDQMLKNNKPAPIYKIREPGDVSLSIMKKTERKAPVKSNVHRLHAPMKFDDEKERIVIRFRDDKLKLLYRLKEYVNSDRESDLMAGIINDYENSI